jgi:hypothetical protein
VVAVTSTVWKLRLQRRIAIEMQYRLLGVHKCPVEHHHTTVEIQPPDGAADRNAMIPGDEQHQRVASGPSLLSA